MRNYYVEGYSMWFVVSARDKRAARSEGVMEFGRGGVKTVRLATEGEVTHFVDMKGKRALGGNT
jgi:hypothetical protein